MKRLLAVLLLVAACALPPLYLLGTADGARRAAGYAADRLGLELTVTGGTLWSGLQIESLGWSADGNSVVASDIDLQPRWRLSCLLRSRVCLEVLALQALSVTMPARAADSTPGLQLPRELELPVGIAIRTLRVAELRVQEGETVHVVRGIHARLRLDEAAIALRDVALEHDAAAFAGHLSLGLADDWPLRARLTAELREGALAADLPARWELTADGPLRALSLQLLSPEIDLLQVRANLVSGADFQSLELALEAQGLQSVPAVAALQPWLQPRGPVALRARLRPGVVRLEVESQLAGYASEVLALDARLSGDAGRWALDRLTLTDSAGLERLALRGPLGRAPDWAPTLNVQLRDLSLPPESGIPLTRVAALAELRLRPADTAALSWQLSRVQASAVYDATPITLQGTLTSAGDHALLPLGSLRGSARDIAFSYTRPVSPGPARLQLPDGLRSDSLQLTRIDAELTPGARSEVLLTVDGDVITTLSLAFEETAAGADWQLQPFDAEVFGQPLASGSSMQGSWLRDSAELLVQPFCWRLRDMSLCSELARLGESGSVDLRLEGGEEWQGALGDNPYSVVARGDGQLHAEWSAAGFQSAALSMRLPVLGIDPFLGAGTEAPTQFEDVTVDAHATPETQTLTLRGGSTSLGQLSADLRRDGVDLSGQVRLAELTLPAFDDLLPEVDLTAGLLSGTLYVAGTLQEPEFSGALELRDGGAMLPGHQVVMSDAQLYLGGRMDAFEVRGDALLGGGPVKIDGRCCDDDVLRLTLDSQRNVLRLPMGLDATISADLAATVDAQRATVRGDVRVHEGLLVQSGPFGDGVSLSDDILRVDTEAEAPRRLAFGAEIRTVIDPGFTLRSKQLEATLAGDLRLVAEAGDPLQLFGNLQVLGGVLRAYGRGLRLAQGSIGFVGDPMNPDLDLSAVRDIRAEQLQVGVRATGTLKQPQLTLFSDPQRSERETLSYLLRGRAPDAGAGADGTAMALSLGASAVNQSGLLDRLNSVPGLSEVSLGAEGSDDETAATISAYVGERLYLSYGMGIYEPVNALTARLYLRSRLWLEVVSRLESSFDVYYRFDRD